MIRSGPSLGKSAASNRSILAARSCRRARSPAPGRRYPRAACSPGRRSPRRRRPRGRRAHRGPGCSWRWPPAPSPAAPRCIEPDGVEHHAEGASFSAVGREDPARAGDVGRGRLAAAGPRIGATFSTARNGGRTTGPVRHPRGSAAASALYLLDQAAGQEAPAPFLVIAQPLAKGAAV